MKRKATWSELTDAEKHIFGQAYLDKMDHHQNALRELQDLLGDDYMDVNVDDV